jgi:hypothetical protein
MNSNNYDFQELFSKIEALLPEKFQLFLQKNNLVSFDFKYTIPYKSDPIYSSKGEQIPTFDHESLTIEIPNVFLRYLWIVNLYIHINLNMYDFQFDTSLTEEEKERISLSNAEFSTFLLKLGIEYKEKYFDWPDEIWPPGFDFEEESFSDKVTLSFFNSILFAYSHEYMHGWHNHFEALKKLALEIGYTNKEIFDNIKISQELDADKVSIRILLSEDKNYAYPILIFFSAIFLLSREKTTRNHIDLFDRFDLVFDFLKLENDDPLWLIPVFAILADEAISEIESSINILDGTETCRDLYEKTLSEYRRRYIP